MITYFIISIFVALVYEITCKLDINSLFRDLLRVIKKLQITFKYENVSDHWKETILLKYSKYIFLKSIKLVLIFLIILIIFYIFTLFRENFGDVILSFSGLIFATLSMIIYLKIRKFFE